MVVHPPAAKSELQQEEDHTEEETGGDAPVIVQEEASVVKDQRTDQALRDVVGETHLAVGREAHQSVVQALVVVLNEEAEAEKQGKTTPLQVFNPHPHAEDDDQGCPR